MGCSSSSSVRGYEFADAFANVIHFDDVEKSFGGSGSVFYQGIKSMDKFVPYLKEHPSVCVFIETHTECPDDGVCTSSTCNRVSDTKSGKIVKYFRENGCANTFTSKNWGCAHPQMKKNLVRISLSTQKEKQPEKEIPPVIIPATAVVPPPPQNDDHEKELAAAKAAHKAQLEEIAKALEAAQAALQQREAQVKALEEEVKQQQLNKQETDLDLELKKMQALEAESQRLANETAAQEAERKRLAFLEAAAEAERRTAAARAAAEEAERKKAVAEAATAAAEKKRLQYVAAAEAAEAVKREHEARIESIRREIEETMKEEIEFVKNKADITDQGKSICDKVIPFLRKVPDIDIYIESHTNCQKGKCDDGCYLMDLSQERVDNVKGYFQKHGCQNKFITKGWGCKHPEYRNVRLVRIFPEHSHKEVIQ